MICRMAAIGFLAEACAAHVRNSSQSRVMRNSASGQGDSLMQILEQKARWVRQQVLEMCARAGEGRIASSLSCVEILVALYHGGILRFDVSNPKWEERDRFLLSKGQGFPALAVVLADLGFFPMEELERFCQPGAMLGPYGGENIPGVEAVWGSLGHGLGVAAGLALAAKMDGKQYRTVVLLGDGELYEGSVWEAAMFAAHHRLDNLLAIVDRNWACVTDFTEQCLKIEPLGNKWRAFGWEVVEIQAANPQGDDYTSAVKGHSFPHLFDAFRGFCKPQRRDKPHVIIADTVKGKGISQLEGNRLGHVIIPQGDELEQARRELSGS